MHVQQVRDTGGAVLAAAGHDLADAVAHCSTADAVARTGDPTELALLDMAAAAACGSTRPNATHSAWPCSTSSPAAG